MASKRHGVITRWVYEYEFAIDRGYTNIYHSTFYSRNLLTNSEAVNRVCAAYDAEPSDVFIINANHTLYSMDPSDFYSNGIILEREPVLIDRS